MAVFSGQTSIELKKIYIDKTRLFTSIKLDFLHVSFSERRPLQNAESWYGSWNQLQEPMNHPIRFKFLF